MRRYPVEVAVVAVNHLSLMAREVRLLHGARYELAKENPERPNQSNGHRHDGRFDFCRLCIHVPNSSTRCAKFTTLQIWHLSARLEPVGNRIDGRWRFGTDWIPRSMG